MEGGGNTPAPQNPAGHDRSAPGSSSRGQTRRHPNRKTHAQKRREQEQVEEEEDGHISSDDPTDYHPRPKLVAAAYFASLPSITTTASHSGPVNPGVASVATQPEAMETDEAPSSLQLRGDPSSSNLL